MMSQHITEIGNFGDFPSLESLARVHDRVAARIDELPLTRAVEEQRRRLNDRLWSIRAVIATTPPKTQADIQALVRIFREEAARDSEFECDCPGAARDLARGLAEACWQGVGGKPCVKTETREVVIKARVSEIGNDRIVVHPNDDLAQSLSVPASDVLVFGGDRPMEENAA